MICLCILIISCVLSDVQSRGTLYYVTEQLEIVLQTHKLTSVQIYVIAEHGNTAGIILVIRMTFLLIMTNVYNSHI